MCLMVYYNKGNQGFSFFISSSQIGHLSLTDIRFTNDPFMNFNIRKMKEGMEEEPHISQDRDDPNILYIMRQVDQAFCKTLALLSCLL